ncbi:MAG TPA: hypothetical protein VMU21_05045 [Thermodesulfovibrionales bacterium]|nr:hypothetical protein [Thermodesulfovibrionales bacterium]
MNTAFLTDKTYCIHLEKRIVARISRGLPMDKRPDLVLWVCHFPLPSLSGIQCPVIVNGTQCPHNGPFGNN